MKKLVEYFSRKFVLSLASLVGTFVLVWYGKDIGPWNYGMLGILMTYAGVNVLQDHVIKTKKDPNQPDPEA